MSKKNSKGQHKIVPAKSWNEVWRERVREKEIQLGRPICGARTAVGAPCTLGSDHPSGRCAFHGGHHDAGAPVGNRNAMTHGLYARRLQTCGEHCLLWEHCPYASEEVVKLPVNNRPHCVYE
jgi:hypothetical protein